VTVFLRAMSMTLSQYSLACALISSLAHRNSTLLMSMPAARHTSIMYRPTVRILFRSPPILLFSSANQSATQNLKTHPAAVSRLTRMAL